MNSHHNNPMTNNEDKVYGILLGTAVGDTLGLPSEGLKPAMIRRLVWSPHSIAQKPPLLFHRARAYLPQTIALPKITHP